MKFFTAAVFLLALAIAGAAQSPSKVLSNAAKALGGEKALKAVTSIRVSGRITRTSDGASGPFSATSAAGGLYAMHYDLNGLRSVRGTTESRDGSGIRVTDCER